MTHHYHLKILYKSSIYLLNRVKFISKSLSKPLEPYCDRCSAARIYHPLILTKVRALSICQKAVHYNCQVKSSRGAVFFHLSFSLPSMVPAAHIRITECLEVDGQSEYIILTRVLSLE